MTEFATKLTEPRVIVRAPNGDLFLAESRAGRVRVFRDADGDGKPEVNRVFAEGLERPFGIAFYPPGPEPKFVYVGNTGSVVRFPYQSGDLKASGDAQPVVRDIPTGREQVGGGGHWTRDLEFSADGKILFVSVGSRSNVDDDDREKRRADILAFDPDGKNERIYAWGIRNPGNKPHCTGEVALGDAVIALTANIAIQKQQQIKFDPAWFDPTRTETPEDKPPRQLAEIKEV